MSKTRLTIEDGLLKTIVLTNDNTDKILELLGNEPAEGEADVVAKFLSRTGVIVSIDTPQSSWVERVEFNPTEKTLTFVATNESRTEGFIASFQDFLDVFTVDSVGKLYWEFKRGKR